MLNDAISATQDALLRGQLERLRRANAVSVSNDSALSSRFRVHGWRWHHLGIIRDLTRLESSALRKRQRLCSVRDARESASLRRQMHDAFEYIMHDNWALHNLVEHTLFLPWVMSSEQNGLKDEAVKVINNERRRLQRHAHMLHERVAEWSEADRYNHSQRTPQCCDSELQNILRGIRRLRRNASLLFDVSEQIVIPCVKLSFSEAEQLRFNSTVLKRISGKQARISLVVFRDAVDLKQPVVADSEDAHNFEQDVPGAIRTVGVPFWRKRFVADKIRFLTED